MGKNQHSKDKLYIVPSEFARDWGGYKKRKNQLPFRALPFYCCGLSLLPFEDPVGTLQGIVFDAKNIIAYIKKYGRNPVDGKAMALSELIPLHFHKNPEGRYHCPVTYKIFNDHSHIVANATSGHVYLNEAIDTLCRKGKSWKDLITGEPFSASDIIHIQHPYDVTVRAIEAFDYIKKGVDPIADCPAEEGSLDAAIQPTEMMGRILEKVRTTNTMQQKHSELYAPKPSAEQNSATDAAEGEVSSDGKPRRKHSLYTTSKQAAGFTSTIVGASSSVTEYRDMTEMEMREELYTEVKKKKLKGYVRLVTSMGNINIQLHTDLTPMACDNFLRHCDSGYYNDTIFHRCVANFMIQGGDPSGTGRGGKSSFARGEPFKDEFHPKLTHTGIGVVSMANNGKNCNKSQFYLTFKSCEHLNNRHTVFGKVVGGLDILREMEGLKVSKSNDKPKVPPVIKSAVIFKNPYEDVVKEREEAEKAAEEDRIKKERRRNLPWFGQNESQHSVSSLSSGKQSVVGSMEVGKYLPPNLLGSRTESGASVKRVKSQN